MFSSSNNFLNTLNSFKSVCLNLEANSDKKIGEIAKQCTDEFSLVAKTLTAFNDFIIGLNKSCTELTNVDEIITTALKKERETTITIPYELQNDFLKCINELYSKSHLEEDSEDKQTLKNDEKVLSDIIESSKNNLIQIKDIIHITDTAKKNLS